LKELSGSSRLSRTEHEAVRPQDDAGAIAVDGRVVNSESDQGQPRCGN
jgi:hypothetical protein